MAVDSSILPYAPSPSLGASAASIGRELAAIKRTIDGIIRMTPQATNKAPQALQDGMLRLARDPWRPAAGQVADAWVYYDAPTNSWLLL